MEINRKLFIFFIHVSLVGFSLFPSFVFGQKNQNLVIPQIQKKSQEDSEQKPPNPLLKAIASDRDDEVIQLLKTGVNPNSKSRSSIEHTPILLATKLQKIETVKILIENGADVEAKNESGLTALKIAISSRNEQLIKILLESGANVNSKNDNNATPIMGASYWGLIRIIEILLKSGARVNDATKAGVTALMGCADSKQVVEILIKAGADVNAKDKEGRNALFHAVNKERIETLEALLENGAEVNIKDRWGVTPLMLAENAFDPVRKEKMIALLMKYGATM